MEFLSPTFRSMVSIRQSVEAGRSLRESIQKIVAKPDGPFDRKLLYWWISIEQGLQPDLNRSFNNIVQRHCAEALSKGLKGEAFLERLKALEEEMQSQMQDTLERHLQRLPVILLLPLLCMIFPSFMILILGPLVQNLLGSLK